MQGRQLLDLSIDWIDRTVTLAIEKRRSGEDLLYVESVKEWIANQLQGINQKQHLWFSTLRSRSVSHLVVLDHRKLDFEPCTVPRQMAITGTWISISPTWILIWYEPWPRKKKRGYGNMLWQLMVVCIYGAASDHVLYLHSLSLGIISRPCIQV